MLQQQSVASGQCQSNSSHIAVSLQVPLLQLTQPQNSTHWAGAQLVREACGLSQHGRTEHTQPLLLQTTSDCLRVSSASLLCSKQTPSSRVESQSSPSFGAHAILAVPVLIPRAWLQRYGSSRSTPSGTCCSSRAPEVVPSFFLSMQVDYRYRHCTHGQTHQIQYRLGRC